jgi:Ca2+/Na+ antiporter
MQPIQLVFLPFVVCGIFLCVLTLCNASSFLTRSVQPISVLLQHHISKLSRYF